MHYTKSRKETYNKRWIYQMEWMNRGSKSPQSASQQPGAVTGAPTPSNNRVGNSNKPGKMQLTWIALLVLSALLVGAVALFVGLGGGGKQNESRFVDTDKLQAVFLNGGQVYFGRVGNLSGKYMTLYDIYYLRVNQQVQPEQEGANQPSANDISLVKLGCELHGPEDAMVINREQIIFWENLKDDGQVAKAVKEYQEQNPDGQDCEQPQQGQQTNGNQNNTPATPPANNGAGQEGN
jgi:hypothetical protein